MILGYINITDNKTSQKLATQTTRLGARSTFANDRDALMEFHAHMQLTHFDMIILVV